MKVNLAIAAAATIVLSSISSTNANDVIEEIIEKESEIRSELSSLHIPSPVSSPANATPKSVNITTSLEGEHWEGQMVGAEYLANDESTPPLDPVEAEEGVVHHEKTKREKHHEAKSGKVQKAANATSTIMSLSPIPFAETTTTHNKTIAVTNGKAAKVKHAKEDAKVMSVASSTQSMPITETKASKAKPAEEDKEEFTSTMESSNSMPTTVAKTGKASKMMKDEDVASVPASSQSMPTTADKIGKSSKMTEDASVMTTKTTVDAKAGKMMKEAASSNMTTTYATEAIQVVVYTERPGDGNSTAAEAVVSSSETVPRVPDATSSGAITNDDGVKSKFEEEITEAMIGGEVAGMTTSTTTHGDRVDLKDKPRASVSALETNGVEHSYASRGTMVVISFCLVASSIAYATV
ncbi:hypothetical protein ACHAXA_006349 [Cyclostephanos tholiformis]|uniref:Uncharacterized protein n=1 Tax=Cyclostephanos tholiformis TaxID=382380 RepID=A0ABD3RBQ4_9STRA